MRRSLLFVSLAACCALLLSSSAAVAKDNWIGSWKLDVAKSKFSPGPAPKSQTLKFEAASGGVSLTSHTVRADGKELHGSYSTRLDGKDVPWKGNPDADTAAPKRIDDNNYENVWKKGGKVTITAKASVSADGKTLTITRTGTNAKGEAVNNVVVFDRK